MNAIIRNWKTTLAGVLALASVIVTYFAPQYATQLHSLTGILAGLGLVVAKDHDVSGQP